MRREQETCSVDRSLGESGLDSLREIAPPRASSILWRIVIGLAALFVMTAGGAWLMHAGIDPSLEAQAASESPAVTSSAKQRDE